MIVTMDRENYHNLVDVIDHHTSAENGTEVGLFVQQVRLLRHILLLLCDMFWGQVGSSLGGV